MFSFCIFVCLLCFNFTGNAIIIIIIIIIIKKIFPDPRRVDGEGIANIGCTNYSFL